MVIEQRVMLLLYRESSPESRWKDIEGSSRSIPYLHGIYDGFSYIRNCHSQLMLYKKRCNSMAKWHTSNQRLWCTSFLVDCVVPEKSQITYQEENERS